MANIRELNTPHVILFLSANPSDTARLRVEREYRGIETQLERAQHRSSFRLHCHSAATPDSIQHAFRKHKPTIVHFPDTAKVREDCCSRIGTAMPN